MKRDQMHSDFEPLYPWYSIYPLNRKIKATLLFLTTLYILTLIGGLLSPLSIENSTVLPPGSQRAIVVFNVTGVPEVVIIFLMHSLHYGIEICHQQRKTFIDYCTCDSMVKNFCWVIYGESFCFLVRILKDGTH